MFQTNCNITKKQRPGIPAHIEQWREKWKNRRAGAGAVIEGWGHKSATNLLCCWTKQVNIKKIHYNPKHTGPLSIQMTILKEEIPQLRLIFEQGPVATAARLQPRETLKIHFPSIWNNCFMFLSSVRLFKGLSDGTHFLRHKNCSISETVIQGQKLPCWAKPMNIPVEHWASMLVWVFFFYCISLQ